MLSTDKQTKTKATKNITSFAKEVINLNGDISVYLILMHKKNRFKRPMQNKETADEKVAKQNVADTGRGIRKNHALCDRNLKFGTMIEYDKTKLLRYRAIAGLTLKQNGCNQFLFPLS